MPLSYQLRSLIPKRRLSGREGLLWYSESHALAEALAPPSYTCLSGRCLAARWSNRSVHFLVSAPARKVMLLVVMVFSTVLHLFMPRVTIKLKAGPIHCAANEPQPCTGRRDMYWGAVDSARCRGALRLTVVASTSNRSWLCFVDSFVTQVLQVAF